MKDKLLCAVGGATSVLTVGFLAAILAIVGYMPDLPKTNVDGQCLKLIDSDELSCGPEQLLKFTIEKNELFYKELKGKYDGGDKTDKDLTELIGLKAFVKTHRADMRPSVRLVGDRRATNEISDTTDAKFVPVRKWKDRKRLASAGGFRRFGVNIKNGRIVIPVSGIYEVYSYIQYREPCINGIPIGNSTDVLTQSIYSYDVTTGKDVVLMSSVQPHKMSKSPHTNMYDSYLVSLFKLRAGDELSIKVNRIDLLKFPEFNFFGAHFIEDCGNSASVR